MRYQTVLFDLDGTLIDTNDLIRISFEYTLTKYNIPYTDEDLKSYNGPPLWETFGKLNPGKEQEMIQMYRTHNQEIHDDYARLFPNVIETIEALRASHIKLGIVTSKMREGVELGLSLTGLDRLIKTVITIDDVTHPKPHPESVIKAMDALGSEAQSTLMVGDNYHDIMSGRNAGIHTIGVTWSHRGEEFLKSYDPTYMIEDMKDILPIVGVKLSE